MRSCFWLSTNLRRCFLVSNQRSAYFPVHFAASYTECDFAKCCTQISCTCAHWNQLFVSLGCELFTVRRSDFRSRRFFFLEFSCQISRFLGFVVPILLKLSSMVGLSKEGDRKLILVRTRAWNQGTKFSKVTLVIKDVFIVHRGVR